MWRDEAPAAARDAWRCWDVRRVCDVGGARGTRAAGAGRAKLARVNEDAKRELVDEGDAGLAAGVRGREALGWSTIRITDATALDCRMELRRYSGALWIR